MNVPFPRPYQLSNTTQQRDIDSPLYNPFGTLPYHHLLQFFQLPRQTEGNTAANEDGAAFYRLLEFVEVPSRFKGTRYTQPNAPSTLYNAGNADWGYTPPFNHIPMHRVPGKININTIYRKNVFTALLNGSLGGGSGNNSDLLVTRLWERLQQSRKQLVNPNDTFNPSTDTQPAYFANPIRPVGANSLVPLKQLREVDEIDVTLWRRDRQNSARTLLAWDPEGDSNVSHDTGTGMIPRTISVGSGTTEHIRGEYNNPSRNPFFRYQLMHRFANLTTVRSNVYAVWMTMGYFEVDPVNRDIYRPDGYTLGAELGLDRGEVNRDRAFYIIDRSIPVGFERGKNHNVKKTILVRRVFE